MPEFAWFIIGAFVVGAAFGMGYVWDSYTRNAAPRQIPIGAMVKHRTMKDYTQMIVLTEPDWEGDVYVRCPCGIRKYFKPCELEETFE